MYLAHRGVRSSGGRLERSWARHNKHSAAISWGRASASLQPPARTRGRGEAQHAQHYTLLISAFAFRSGSGCPESRLQARSARNRLSPARPRRHGRGAPASLDPHKATARLGPVRGHPSCNAACSLQHCSTAVRPSPTLFSEARLKHQTFMTELRSVGTRRSILNYDALSLCLNIN